MKDWKTILISPKTTIFEALRIVDASAIQIALVVDENQRLLGTVTDGDVRRAILKQIPFEKPVDDIMYTSPTVASIDDDEEKILSLMRRKDIQHIPVLDEAKRVVDLRILKDLVKTEYKDNVVVIMAGGLGTRLQPLTNECPKPLLRIGQKPIMETIIDNFINYGFRRFYISVNYKADMIERHFEDGSRWNVSIGYLQEEKKLGTAGALSLLPELPTQPFIVMNGDLLTEINFNHLLEFHQNRQSDATMCVREYDFKVPFGVVHIDNDRLLRIEEKPKHSFFINAGIYVFEPCVLSDIPKNSDLDMPHLFEDLVSKKKNIRVFPIREYWIDIGMKEDYEKANGEYSDQTG